MRALTGNTAKAELKVSVWNARQFHAGSASEDSASQEKLRWIQGRLDGETPDVCFLLEVTGTRDDYTDAKKGLRARMKDSGYSTHWIPGEGGSARERKGTDTNSNGIAILTRNQTCKLMSYRRLEERLLGALVRLKGENPCNLKIGAIHGLHEEGSSAFSNQIEAASTWSADAGHAGALLLGDFNYIADSSWRSTASILSKDDNALRDLISGATAQADYVYGRVGSADKVIWTRRPGNFAVSSGAREGEGAMLDGALAFGGEKGKWVRATVDFARKSNGDLLSDHAWLTFVREIPKLGMQGATRPRALLPRGDTLIKEKYREAIRSGTVALEIQECAREKEQALGTGDAREIFATTRAISKLRQVAEQTIEAVVAQRNDTPKEASHRWRGWLREAYHLRGKGVDPREVRGGLFMACSGLGSIRRRYDNSDSAYIWEKIIKRCHRQLGRAKAKLIRRQQREDEKVKELSLGIISGKRGGDAMRQAMDAWRAIKKPTENIAFDSFFPKDDVNQPPVKAHDSNFAQGLAKEGERMVEGFASTPPVIEAFQAFCGIFCPMYETLRGRDGGHWELLKELTYTVFLQVLERVPRGKAVGAGGFSIELLLNADDATKEAFYKCLIADLKGEQYPEEWRKVIYVLLVKPAPSNPALISERREIALMAQDMKLIMHMVRATAYRRITGRLRLEQCGWLPGYGTIDAGLPLAAVIQQAKRLRHSLWILYIDMATFFPRIDREVLTVAELLVGLPQPVIDLVAKIYGAGRATAWQAVECQFDSAVGLSAPFKNYMGALMGEVLSPDRAKILLNSILWAIKLFTQGVELFGFGADEEGCIRAIAQMAYADDWAGTFTSEADLKKAWTLWQTWVPISGCKIGIKKLMKTVITGVLRNELGEERDIADPGLETLEGTRIPVMTMTEAYKHLGVLRTACGNEAAAEAGMKKQLRAAIGRIKKMYKPKIQDIVLVTNGLFQGLAGFKGSTSYYSFEFMEDIEKEWRRVYNRKMKRDSTTPTCLLYEYGGGVDAEGNKRRHLWTISCTAFYAAFSRAMSDMADTSQRAAARSTLALSMSRWGCQEDPAHFQWKHLLESLERTLKSAKTKYLGDAFMLIAGLIKPKEANSANWLYTRPLDRTDPLRDEQPHFHRLESVALFDTEADAGLGIQIAPQLLEARIRSAGQMACAGVEGPRWMTFKEARTIYRHLPEGAGAEWQRTIERLEELEVWDVFPERETHQIWGQRTIDEMCGGRTQNRAQGGRTTMDDKSLCELQDAIRKAVKARKEGIRDDNDTDWDGLLRRTFQGTFVPSADEWSIGGADVRAEAEGGRLFFDGGEDTLFVGGEATWMKEHQVDQHGFLWGWRDRAEEMRKGFAFDDLGYLCHESCGRITLDDLDQLAPAVQMTARARLALGEVSVIEGDGEKRETTHVQLRSQYKMWGKITTWAARIEATKVYTLDGSRRTVNTDNGGKMTIATRAAVDHRGKILGGRFMGELGVGEDNYHAELIAQLDALEDATRAQGERVIIVFDATSPVRAMLRFGRLGARARGDRLAAELLEHFERLRRRCSALVLLWQTSHVGEPINEYADITCDTFGVSDVSPVPRYQIEYASITFPGHSRSAQEYAAQGMAKVVAVRLQQHVRNTILRDPEEQIKLLKLTEEAAAICEAIGARRYQYADQPYPSRRMEMVLDSEVCPFGCVKHATGWRELSPAAAARRTTCEAHLLASHFETHASGEKGERLTLSPVQEKELGAEEISSADVVSTRGGRWFGRDACAPTWWHFHFECTGAAMVTARKQYALAAVKALRDMYKLMGPGAHDRGFRHGQIKDLITVIHMGLDGWQAEDGAAGTLITQGYLRARIQRGELENWTRAAAGAIDRTGHQVDDSSKWRASVTEMVIAGCAMQKIGKEKCGRQARTLRNQVSNWHLLSTVMKAWVGILLAAGVQRTTDLRDIRLASSFVRQKGALNGHERRRLQAATAKMIQDVDDTARENVPSEWLKMRVWLAWRLVLARGQGRSNTMVVQGGGAEPLRELLWLAAKGQQKCFRMQAASEGTLETLALFAWRKWLRIGGTGALVATRKKMERARRLRQLNAQKEGMRRWARLADGTRWKILTEKETEDRIELVHDKLSAALNISQVLTTREWRDMGIRGLRVGHFVKVGGAFFYGPEDVASSNTLSGKVVEDQGETVEIEIGPRGGAEKQKERRRAVLKSRRDIRKRAVMRRAQQGEEPDDSGRWAIHRIVQVERPPTSRRGRPLKVLVNWVGGDEQGVPWHDSWVSISMLTLDQRAEARRLERDKYASAEDRKQGGKQRQKKGDQEEEKHRWEVRLRSRKREREES